MPRNTGVVRFRKMDTAVNEGSSRMDSGRIVRLPKAEDWLSLVAEHVDTVWDQDALVYLRSRGHDCHDQVNRLIHSWKVGAQQRLDRDFWDAPALGDYSVEATLLRTAEWCEIEGFEPWWRRLAQNRQERLLRGGIEDAPVAAYWLFNMVRSDYAMRLMPRVLDGYLGSISLTSPSKPQPWVFGDVLGPDDLEHLAYASALIFARYRLRSNGANAGLIDQAVAALCRYQDQSGAWRASTSDPEMSIEATAMALHALALARPRGWPRIAANGRDWLWSVQADDGSWTEVGTPGPTYLTVLVLDAINLADSEKSLTFRLASVAQEKLPELSGNVLLEADLAKARVDDSAMPKNAQSATVPQPTAVEPAIVAAALDTAEQRRAAVQAYLIEVFDRTGRRITKTDLWKAARYSSRTEFERWERNDRRATPTAHARFSRLLAEKPHLRPRKPNLT